MKINRIIRKRLVDADGNPVGDVNAALAVNVGEPGGSETHVSSHSRIVQTSHSAQVHTTSESSTRPAPPAVADETKEAT